MRGSPSYVVVNENPPLAHWVLSGGFVAEILGNLNGLIVSLTSNLLDILRLAGMKYLPRDGALDGGPLVDLAVAAVADNTDRSVDFDG